MVRTGGSEQRSEVVKRSRQHAARAGHIRPTHTRSRQSTTTTSVALHWSGGRAASDLAARRSSAPVTPLGS